MKIFIDGAVFQIPATGIAKSTLELYKHVVKLEPNIEVTVLHKNKLKTILPPEIKSVQLGSYKSIHFSRYVPNLLWRSLFLPIYIAIHKPDVVHFPWNGNVPRFLYNSKIVTTIYDLIPLRVSGFFKNSHEEKNFRKKIQKSIDRSDLIITVSNFSKKEIMHDFQLDREPLIIYIGPTINCKKHIKSSYKNKTYFLYVGGYDKRKGIEKLIETFMKLVKENKIQSKLVLTGEKNYYSPYLKDLINEGIMQGFLEEKGYVSESELCFLYTNAKALVYPSTYEGYGLPPLEAMKMGCPVITTNVTSIPEVCDDAVYYVDVNSEFELFEALIALEKDKKLRNKLKSLGKIQVSKFSWESISRYFFEKLKKL